MNIGAYESKVLNGCLEIVKLIYALWYMLKYSVDVFLIVHIYFDKFE